MGGLVPPTPGMLLILCMTGPSTPFQEMLVPVSITGSSGFVFTMNWDWVFSNFGNVFFLHGGNVLSVRAGCRTFHPSLFAEVPWQRGHWCGFCFVLVGLVCAVFVCCFIPLPGSENLILFSACCNIAASQQTV